MNAHDLLSNNVLYKGELNPLKDIDTIISTVKAIAKLNDASCLLIDFDNHQVLYATPKLLYIDKVLPKDKKRDCANPYWSCIPEEVLDFLIQLKRGCLHLRHSMNLEEFKSHVCITDYPIIVNGRKFYITQRFTPLVVDSIGIIRIGMFTITPSARRRIESTITTDSGKCYLYNPGLKIYEPRNYSSILTDAEKRILICAEMRMSNEEIADYQNISLSAVKANITRILKKLGVKKISEAVTAAQDYRII